MHENITFIKSERIKKACFFLENMGFFHPFGLELSLNDKILLIGVEESDINNMPTDEKIVERISTKLLDSLENNNSKTIGIAINTTFRKANLSDINTIEIRILDNSTEELQTYVRYFLNNCKVEIFNETETPWAEM
jgi:hypothetical protein